MATSASRSFSEREQDNDDGVEHSRRPGSPIDPLRLWTALRQRRMFILITGLLGAFIGAAVAKKFAAQTFVAHGVLTWEAGAPTLTQNIERTTIVESMTMDQNLDEVRRRLKLSMPLRMLREDINVVSNDGSNNIVIDAKWPSGQGAADLVNTTIDVFLESRNRAVSDRLQNAVARQREAEAETRKRQVEALQAYDDFRRSEGFSDISQERELAITQYAELAVRADHVRSRADSLRNDSEGGGGYGSPAEEKQAKIEALRLSQAKSELESARRNYSDDHPNVRRLTAEVEALEQRVRAWHDDPSKRRARAEAAEAKRKTVEEYQTQLKTRLEKLSSAEGKAAILLGELKVAEEAHARASELLTAAQLEAAQPKREFRVHERATAPQYAEQSPRKRIAIAFPIVFFVLAVIGSLFWSLRNLDVRTPKEAAFWSGVPVVGASTWPRDPDMLPSLMHDLDDFAPHAAGVTLIVGLSLSEAHLARKVAEWDPRRISQGFDDPAHLLMSGAAARTLLLPGSEGGGRADELPPQRQILTLNGPVPAQALRRAARLADRVLVVVSSGRHSVTQLMKIRGRLGRDKGIGVLLVGLEKDFAMVRDRVGDVGEFWQTTVART